MNKWNVKFSADGKEFLGAERVGEPPPPPVPSSGDNILVVYREDNEKNASIVFKYAQARDIPGRNLLHIPKPVYFAHSFQQNYDELYAPIKEKLAELGEEKIVYIVLVGILKKVQSPIPDQKYIATQQLISRIYALEYEPSDYSNINESFRSEKPTPYTHPFSGPVRYLVSSIDNEKQIDDAIYAEQNDVEGTFIFDSKFIDSPNKIEQSIYRARDLAKQHGKKVRWHSDRDVLGKEDSDTWSDGTEIEYPVPTKFYTGWYGFFEKDAFKFLPGSVYSQVISYWTNPHQKAIDAGATFVSGPVMEPYTDGVAQPYELVSYMLRGYSWGEAVLYSVPKKMWANHASGDPVARWK